MHVFTVSLVLSPLIWERQLERECLLYTRANSYVDRLLTEHRRKQRVCCMADTYMETFLCYFTKMPQVLKDYA